MALCQPVDHDFPEQPSCSFGSTVRYDRRKYKWDEAGAGKLKRSCDLAKKMQDPAFKVTFKVIIHFACQNPVERAILSLVECELTSFFGCFQRQYLATSSRARDAAKLFPSRPWAGLNVSYSLMETHWRLTEVEGDLAGQAIYESWRFCGFGNLPKMVQKVWDQNQNDLQAGENLARLLSKYRQAERDKASKRARAARRTPDEGKMRQEKANAQRRNVTAKKTEAVGRVNVPMPQRKNTGIDRVEKKRSGADKRKVF